MLSYGNFCVEKSLLSGVNFFLYESMGIEPHLIRAVFCV